MWSLTDLYRMPFSEIKVDHSLLADAPREPDAQLIVRTIADLAHKLDITVCAEGVETRDMLEFVRAARFDSAQGRLFGASMSAVDIERLVVGGRAPRPRLPVHGVRFGYYPRKRMLQPLQKLPEV